MIAVSVILYVFPIHVKSFEWCAAAIVGRAVLIAIEEIEMLVD